MEYLALAVAWPRFVDGPLRKAKRTVLLDHVAPALDALSEEGAVDCWSHTFWADDDLGTNVVQCICAAEDAAAAGERVREAFTDLGLEEGVEFRVKAPYDPARFRRFWGDHLDTWVRTKAGLSSLAVAAVREELGESYAWHREQNRPGHIWANQLGMTYMDEAAAYQSLALGYFEQVPMENASDEQRAAFDEVREHMRAAADALPDP